MAQHFDFADAEGLAGSPPGTHDDKRRRKSAEDDMQWQGNEEKDDWASEWEALKEEILVLRKKDELLEKVTTEISAAVYANSVRVEKPSSGAAAKLKLKEWHSEVSKVVRTVAQWPQISLVRVLSRAVEFIFKETQDAKAKVQEIKDELNRQRLQQHFVVVPPYTPLASHYKSPVRTMFRSVIDLIEYNKEDQDEVGQLNSAYKPTTIWPMLWHDQPEWSLSHNGHCFVHGIYAKDKEAGILKITLEDKIEIHEVQIEARELLRDFQSRYQASFVTQVNIITHTPQGLQGANAFKEKGKGKGKGKDEENKGKGKGKNKGRRPSPSAQRDAGSVQRDIGKHPVIKAPPVLPPWQLQQQHQQQVQQTPQKYTSDAMEVTGGGGTASNAASGSSAPVPVSVPAAAPVGALGGSPGLGHTVPLPSASLLPAHSGAGGDGVGGSGQ